MEEIFVGRALFDALVMRFALSASLGLEEVETILKRYVDIYPELPVEKPDLWTIQPNRKDRRERWTD
jgi:hypothetical protein